MGKGGDTRDLWAADATQVRLTVAEWLKLLALVGGAVYAVFAIVRDLDRGQIALQVEVRQLGEGQLNLRSELQYLRERIDSSRGVVESARSD